MNADKNHETDSGHLEVLFVQRQRAIHEITPNVTKHEAFRVVSCDFVDRAFHMTQENGTLRLKLPLKKTR
jgi:hypothetical protein